MCPTAGAPTSPQDVSDAPSKELDIYAAEFADLVDRYTPHRDTPPSEWLKQLPGEVFLYYREGISTFGRTASTPVERRGRLYLIHTALLFMWMSWGRDTARDRFRNHLQKGTRRAASLVKLESYRRADVLVDYDVPGWFLQSTETWRATLRTNAVRADAVPDAALERTVRTQPTLDCPVGVLASLRAAGALPSLWDLPLEDLPLDA
jgi:hypothetical protein